MAGGVLGREARLDGSGAAGAAREAAESGTTRRVVSMLKQEPERKPGDKSRGAHAAGPVQFIARILSPSSSRSKSLKRARV